jgi:anti-anti-sigma factor
VLLSERDDHSVVAEIEFADGTAVVRLLGDLDITVASALWQQLAELADKKPDRLVFDMTAVGFLDCAAARVLFRASRVMLPDGKPVIRSPCPLVRTLLERTGWDTQCELAGNSPSPGESGRRHRSPGG